MTSAEAHGPILSTSFAQPNIPGDGYIDGAVLNGMEQLPAWPYPAPQFNGIDVNNPPIDAPQTPFGKRQQGASPSSPFDFASPIPVKPTLYIGPTPTKSRVETQIQIKLSMYPMPPSVTKLHLPPHTISKPKLLAKPPPERSSDMLELSTTLVCTSAMHDTAKLKRACDRAAGRGSPVIKKEEGRRSSAGDAVGAGDDEDQPANGGEVHICQGCIIRERKRAARKKTKKPEEEEPWQKDEAKRIIVFNCNEIKEWQDPSASDVGVEGEAAAAAVDNLPTDQFPRVPDGAFYIDVPMRIACYCRHQSEKEGFRYAFLT
jgi:hypothetical protein